MVTDRARKIVYDRSGMRCEAMVSIKTSGIYTRCWKMPIEIHHLLTRARGGGILDRVHETYHLIALCPECHRASDGGDAYMGNLLIEGYVTTVQGAPRYIGPDVFLADKYGDRKLPAGTSAYMRKNG